MTVDPAAVADRLARLRARIAAAESAAGRPPGSCGCCSPPRPRTRTRSARRWTPTRRSQPVLVGENRVQELVAKGPVLHGLGVTTHLIGPLQSNKVNAAAALGVVHRVGRVAGPRAAAGGPGARHRGVRAGQRLGRADEARRRTVRGRRRWPARSQSWTGCGSRPDDRGRQLDRRGRGARGLRAAAGPARRGRRVGAPGTATRRAVDGHERRPRARDRRGRDDRARRQRRVRGPAG